MLISKVCSKISYCSKVLDANCSPALIIASASRISYLCICCAGAHFLSGRPPHLLYRRTLSSAVVPLICDNPSSVVVPSHKSDSQTLLSVVPSHLSCSRTLSSVVVPAHPSYILICDTLPSFVVPPHLLYSLTASPSHARSSAPAQWMHISLGLWIFSPCCEPSGMVQ